MTVRVFSDQAGTTAAAANDNIGKVEDLSKFDSDGVSSTTGPYLSVDANGFGSADILGQGGDVVQTFTNAITDGSALVVGTSKCIFFSNVNVEAGGTLTIGPAGDMINTNGLNLIGKVVSVATTTKVLTTAEQNSIATFFAERGASSVVVNDETVYDVNSVEADVVLDFNGSSFYRNVPHYFKLGGTYSTFADAFMGNSPKLTYNPGSASSSQSTMTQGYGPELVANGGFNDGSTGWTAGTGWSIDADEGVATHSGAAGPLDYGLAGMDTSKTYEVSIQITGNVSGNLAVQFVGGGTVTLYNASAEFGTIRAYGSPLSSTPTLRLYGGTNATYTIDNISVQEAPKIVWAPHNLALNSAAPATQTITVTSGADYTVEVTGAGSMALTGAGTGTATDGSPATITASTTSLTITLTGSLDTVAVYRSDLGGMAQVPGADTGFEYYVPTNGNAEYLPRVGHHVYNGSTWVNEGLLIESEARTNLITLSNDFDTAPWSLAGTLTSVTQDQIGPDGETSAWTMLCNTVNSGHYMYGSATVGTGDHTMSAYLKYSNHQWAALRFTEGGGTAYFASFDMLNGVKGSVSAGATSSMVDVGNGWYRCSVTANSTTSATQAAALLVALNPSNTLSLPVWTPAGTEELYVYGAQLEQGQVVNGTPVDAPTPSSYIPTNGSTVIRGGQSLVVPPAEFGWPEPEYIGPELVGGSDGSDASDWSAARSNSTVTSDGVRIRSTSTAAGAYGPMQQLTGLTVGNVYRYTADVFTAGGAGIYYFRITAVAGLNDTETVNETSFTDFSPEGEFVATNSTMYVGVIHVAAAAGDYVEIDNISVREINPLSVSIQMDGRMTYADEDYLPQHELVRWYADASNYCRYLFDTQTGTGGILFRQEVSGSRAETSAYSAYSPGILTPFNIASRHGSTFINGAVDGVALTANTTPTALPDLSNTDLQIAYDFMGTIGTFRQFAGDVGDAGLVTATNPSTEPTLSLTFDGTGGSFYNLNWSE